jgi:hypothetical protein
MQFATGLLANEGGDLALDDTVRDQEGSDKGGGEDDRQSRHHSKKQPFQDGVP